MSYGVTANSNNGGATFKPVNDRVPFLKHFDFVTFVVRCLRKATSALARFRRNRFKLWLVGTDLGRQKHVRFDGKRMSLRCNEATER